VLLDRTELGRGLRFDLHQKMLRGLLGQILRGERLLLALAVPNLDLCRDVLRDLGAKAEGLVFGKETVPLLGQLRVVRKVVPLPVLDRVVVLLRQRADVVFHTSRVPSLVREWSYRSLQRTGGSLGSSAGRSGRPTVPRQPWRAHDPLDQRRGATGCQRNATDKNSANTDVKRQQASAP